MSRVSSHEKDCTLFHALPPSHHINCNNYASNYHVLYAKPCHTYKNEVKFNVQEVKRLMGLEIAHEDSDKK